MSSARTILLTGGTGKVASRTAALLSAHGDNTLVASRSGTTPNLPHCRGIKFDWFDEASWPGVFENVSISAILLVASAMQDCGPVVNKFIDLARTKGVNRFVLLSASSLEVEDGPLMSQISKYILTLDVEYAILRPTWFMENFSQLQHQPSIKNKDRIVTATGNGKVPFIACDDIAAVAFHALTDEKSHNNDHLILGPELLSYDEVATLFTKLLGRKITHVSVTEEELIGQFTAMGGNEGYAKAIAQMDTAISHGSEARLSDAVFRVTGKQPKSLGTFIGECIGTGCWDQELGRRLCGILV